MIFVKCTMDRINVERYEYDVNIMYKSPVNFTIRVSQYVSPREILNSLALRNFHIFLHEIMRATFMSCVGFLRKTFSSIN